MVSSSDRFPVNPARGKNMLSKWMETTVKPTQAKGMEPDGWEPSDKNPIVVKWSFPHSLTGKSIGNQKASAGSLPVPSQAGLGLRCSPLPPNHCFLGISRDIQPPT